MLGLFVLYGYVYILIGRCEHTVHTSTLYLSVSINARFQEVTRPSVHARAQANSYYSTVNRYIPCKQDKLPSDRSDVARSHGGYRQNSVILSSFQTCPPDFVLRKYCARLRQLFCSIPIVLLLAETISETADYEYTHSYHVVTPNHVTYYASTHVHTKPLTII